MDPSMILANAISFAGERWSSEDAYYRHYDRRQVRRMRSLPIASAAVLMGVIIAISAGFSG